MCTFRAVLANHIFIAATLVIFFSIPATAQSQSGDEDLINADRPGIADGSTVVGTGAFQIESGVQEEFRRSGNDREHTFFVPTLLRFGLDSRWEVRIEGNTFTRVTTFDSVDTHTSVFAPVSLGL